MKATVRPRLSRFEVVYTVFVLIVAAAAFLPSRGNYVAYLLLCLSTLPISVVAISFVFFVGGPAGVWLGDNVRLRLLYVLVWVTLAALQLRTIILVGRDVRERRAVRRSVGTLTRDAKPGGHYGSEQPTDSIQPRMHGTAITVLVLAILSFCQPITAIMALVMAPRVQRSMDSAGGRLMGRGLVKAGRIISWINITTYGVVLLIAIVVTIFGDHNDNMGMALASVVR